MVTTADILAATGLKASKTLTRWHQRGAIPPPTVAPHPSGRGKTSYWPDWVLDRCVRLAELQRSGKTLDDALVAIEMERIETLLAAAEKPAVELDDIPVKVGDREYSIGDLAAFEIARAAAEALPGLMSGRDLTAKLRSQRAGDTALALLNGGYNPVALIGLERTEIVPDFVVSHRLVGGSEAFVAINVLEPLRQLFRKLGQQLDLEPSVIPAPSVWATEEGGRVEYSIYPGGPAGFELIRESARVVRDTRNAE